MRILDCLSIAIEGRRPDVLQKPLAQLTLSKREQAMLESHKQFAQLKLSYTAKFKVSFRLVRTSDSTVRIVLEGVP